VEVAVYIGNGMRYANGYYGSLIGSRRQQIVSNLTTLKGGMRAPLRFYLE